MDPVWLQARIAATKTIIENYETAIAAVSASTQAAYQLDTGQSVVRVTYKNLGVLQSSLDEAYNLLAVLEARLYGAGGQYRPAW